MMIECPRCFGIGSYRTPEKPVNQFCHECDGTGILIPGPLEAALRERGFKMGRCTGNMPEDEQREFNRSGHIERRRGGLEWRFFKLGYTDPEDMADRTRKVVRERGTKQ